MKGVVVTGPSRSGTSMVAGLLAVHGVFFGETFGPHDANPKGNLESKWLKEIRRSGEVPPSWPVEWFEQLRREGWDDEMPWGAKVGPNEWSLMAVARPTVLVTCWRPAEDIVASRKRAPGWRACPESSVEFWHDQMRELEASVSCDVVPVQTPDVARGDYAAIERALDVLGLDFDPEAADDWVDPELFHG